MGFTWEKKGYDGIKKTTMCANGNLMGKNEHISMELAVLSTADKLTW